MTSIRPLRRADLPAVASLMAQRLPDWTHDESFLAETLIDQRWASPDFPSLVAVDGDEAIMGFIGAQVRRMRLDDRVLHAVCCSHLVVADDRRAGAAGALLLRRMLSGDQELTWTDTATETVARMWRSFGGYRDPTRSLDWMLVLKPFRWARGAMAAAARRRTPGRELAPVRAIPLQAAGPRFASDAFPSPPASVRGEDATAAAIVEELEGMARDVRLRVDYEEEQLNGLFVQVEAEMGPLVRRLVRRDGAPVGWYAYLSRPDGVSRVLHLCGPGPELEAVFGELVVDARERGSVALAGRLEPHLEEPLTRRLAVSGFARWPLVHSRDLEIRALLATSSSLLTHLDGEWFVA